MTRSKPCSTNCAASSYPMPLEAPVTTASGRSVVGVVMICDSFCANRSALAAPGGAVVTYRVPRDGPRQPLAVDSRRAPRTARPGPVGSARAVTGALGWTTIGERPRHRGRMPCAWAFPHVCSGGRMSSPNAESTAFRSALEVIRGRRAADRRRHRRRAGRPARVAQADRQRELRLPGDPAGHGQLVQRQVRRGHRRPPLLRRLPATSTPSRRSPPSTPGSCSARRTPTSSRTPASTPTWSRSGRSWPTGSRPRP